MANANTWVLTYTPNSEDYTIKVEVDYLIETSPAESEDSIECFHILTMTKDSTNEFIYGRSMITTDQIPAIVSKAKIMADNNENGIPDPIVSVLSDEGFTKVPE